jgi:DNA-binding transcriptional MocR family regulator
VRLRDDLDPSAIVADAASNGVSVEQLDSYTVDRALPGLCLGFGRIGIDDVDEALDRLGRSAAGAGRVGDARSTA